MSCLFFSFKLKDYPLSFRLDSKYSTAQFLIKILNQSIAVVSIRIRIYSCLPIKHSGTTLIMHKTHTVCTSDDIHNIWMHYDEYLNCSTTHISTYLCMNMNLVLQLNGSQPIHLSRPDKCQKCCHSAGLLSREFLQAKTLGSRLRQESVLEDTSSCVSDNQKVLNIQ